MDCVLTHLFIYLVIYLFIYLHQIHIAWIICILMEGYICRGEFTDGRVVIAGVSVT